MTPDQLGMLLMSSALVGLVWLVVPLRLRYALMCLIGLHERTNTHVDKDALIETKRCGRCLGRWERGLGLRAVTGWRRV